MGCLFVVSAPSGTGKTTLVSRLCSEIEGIALSVSYTTRSPRSNEVEGVHYHFVDTNSFKDMIERGDFIEWAVVHNNYYGTSKQEILKRLQSGLDTILDIDTQGAQEIKRLFPDSVLIFIMPPSFEELKRRLYLRGTDDEETISIRLKRAEEEIDKSTSYDYIVVNDDLERSLQELKCIVLAERCKTNRLSFGL